MIMWIVHKWKDDLEMTSRCQVDPWVNYLFERKNFRTYYFKMV